MVPSWSVWDAKAVTKSCETRGGSVVGSGVISLLVLAPLRTPYSAKPPHLTGGGGGGSGPNMEVWTLSLRVIASAGDMLVAASASARARAVVSVLLSGRFDLRSFDIVAYGCARALVEEARAGGVHCRPKGSARSDNPAPDPADSCNCLSLAAA